MTTTFDDRCAVSNDIGEDAPNLLSSPERVVEALGLTAFRRELGSSRRAAPCEPLPEATVGCEFDNGKREGGPERRNLPGEPQKLRIDITLG